MCTNIIKMMDTKTRQWGRRFDKIEIAVYQFMMPCPVYAKIYRFWHTHQIYSIHISIVRIENGRT